jgi:hypothetical protein
MQLAVFKCTHQAAPTGWDGAMVRWEEGRGLIVPAQAAFNPPARYSAANTTALSLV